MRLPLISATMLLPAMLLAGTAQAEPMKPLLQKLVMEHPRILAETENTEAARAAKMEANAGYLPRIDATASGGYEDTDRTELVPAGDDFDLNPTNAVLSVTQNVFDGYRTTGLSNSANAALQLAQNNRQGTEQQVLFEAVSTYLNVLLAVQLTQLSQENMRTLQKQLNLEDERVDRGSGIAVDVLQAKSRLQISKERFTAFIGRLKDASSNYAQVFGAPANIETMQLPEIPVEMIPATLEEATSIAIANNPLLKSSQLNAEVARYRKDSASAGFYPSIDLVASSSYEDDFAGIRGTEVSNAVVARASWQIFSGFADQARSKQATHTHQAALAQAANAQRKVTEEVRLAWSNLITSRERADLLDNAVNIAGEVYDARSRLRDAGSDTALNVLDAENELFSARIDATAARYNYYTAVYRLLLAMGRLQLDNLK